MNNATNTYQNIFNYKYTVTNFAISDNGHNMIHNVT